MSAIARVEEEPAVFRIRFWRSYGMLRFIAFHVLGGPARAEEAIENCWYTASRGVPLFEYEGEFRSWLLRVFIEEALALLLESRQRSNLKPLRYLRRTGVAVGFQSRSD